MIKAVTPVFFTIVAKNYIAYARTLCASIAQHHPDAKIYVGLSDSDAEGVLQASDCFELISVDQLDLPDPDQFAFRYDVMEFSTAIKPYVFRWLLANSSADRIIYLDPDILVLSPLAEVLSLLEQGATATLTPHLIARVDDGFDPDETAMLRVGIYNLGFFAISRCDESAKLIDWWCDRLERGAVVDLEKGLFTDQKWADLMPALFDGVSILRSPGYNVAYWNLMHRSVSTDQGDWFANGQRISFFHFSGVDPAKPGIFSKHQNRYTLTNIGELKALYEHYIDLLKRNGYFEALKTPYGYGLLADGTRIHPAMRVYFRHFFDTGRSSSIKPFQFFSAAYFNSLETTLNGNRLVTRFMYGLYLKQRELQAVSDINSPAGQQKFANWFSLVAADAYKVEHVFIDAVRKHLKNAINEDVLVKIDKPNLKTWFKVLFIRGVLMVYRLNPQLARNVARMLPRSYSARLKSDAVELGRLPLRGENPNGLLHKVFSMFGNVDAYLNHLTAQIKSRSSRSKSGQQFKVPAPHGLTLIGYPRGDFGVAQNLRSVANSLNSVEYPYDVFEVNPDGTYSDKDGTLSHLIVDESAYAVQLACINADVTIHYFKSLNKDKSKCHYRIGYWFWELANFPEAWMRAFDYVDEVWAPSRFILQTLTKVATKPVIYMPVAVDFTIQGNYSRAGFKLADDKYLFFFSYDFNSFSERKNPDAVIKAFLQAFPEHEQGMGLVIKTINAEKYPEAYVQLLELAQQDSRIKIINCILSRDEMYGLMNVCDCYVSLHRAEGFGLGLAEAMLLGKPVIATAYSGNMDFMNADNSCVVDYKLVPVPTDAYPFGAGQEWADPDIEQAAGYMRRLYADESYRTEIARNGQQWVQREHSSARVGSLMRERLNKIEALHL